MVKELNTHKLIKNLVHCPKDTKKWTTMFTQKTKTSRAVSFK